MTFIKALKTLRTCISISLWLGMMQLAYAAKPAAAPAVAPSQDAQELRTLKGYPAYQRGDFVAAEREFRKAAQSNVRAAQYNLAVMILRGETKTSTREPEQPDYLEAIEWMNKSAALEFADAQYALGKLYEQGGLLPRDLKIALGWYARAAELGMVDAQVELAAAYMLGRGVARDAKLAAQWAEKAANAGDVGAQYLVASFYESGEGVKQDLPTAMQWYVQAARNGDVAAPIKAKEIAARIKATN
jgi:uncharacterized protein